MAVGVAATRRWVNGGTGAFPLWLPLLSFCKLVEKAIDLAFFDHIPTHSGVKAVLGIVNPPTPGQRSCRAQVDVVTSLPLESLVDLVR